MSTTGDGDLAPGGQEGPAGALGSPGSVLNTKYSVLNSSCGKRDMVPAGMELV